MKFKKIITSLLVAIAVFCIVQLNAIAINIQTLKRKLAGNKNQYIHLFWDHHGSIIGEDKDAIEQQIDDSIEIIDDLGVDNVAVFVEAPHSYEGNDQFLKPYYPCVKVEHNEFLYAIYDSFKADQIPVENIEIDCLYYCLLVERGKIDLPPTQDFLLRYENSIKAELAKIDQYNHGTLLTNYYKKVIASYKKVLPGLSSNPRLFSHRVCPTAKHRMIFGVMSALREINLLKGIYQCDKQHVFVYCGGDHINSIVPKLIKGLKLKHIYSCGKAANGAYGKCFLKRLTKVQHRNHKPTDDEKKDAQMSAFCRTVIVPISIEDYFEELFEKIDRDQRVIAWRTAMVFSALGITALLYYNWPTITNIWQSIFNSTPHSTSSAHTQAH